MVQGSLVFDPLVIAVQATKYIGQLTVWSDCAAG